MSENRPRADDLFEAALEVAEAERGAWLERACGGDAALRHEVEELLAAHALSRGILDARAAASPSAPGLRRIGPYRVHRELGRGGTGVVYLAERDDGQFRRLVAIKLLRGSPDAEELRSRFLAERQILASLDHPNIAQLLDAGVTDGQLPYLVMEYVEGLPITTYCDRHRLDVKARLRLFQSVCAAVHHAHRNLVIHRDLKPSNILVTASGQVKLLDFGIAKLQNPVLGGVPLAVTRTDVRVTTPEYASPEQVRGEPLSTASDIYALGVVLYELLTGSRPHGAPGGGSAGELAGLIDAREPVRPSMAVALRQGGAEDGRGGADGALTPAAVAAARDTTPERLSRALKGDLDAIVMMALRSEPSRRYGSADLLAEDVRRYLEGQPVLAHKGSRRYYARKYLERHRAVAAVAALAALSLASGAGLAVWQAGVARTERDRAELARAETEAAPRQAEQALRHSEEVTAFLVGLFEAGDPAASAGDLVTARDLLGRGMARIEALSGSPTAATSCTTSAVTRAARTSAATRPIRTWSGATWWCRARTARASTWWTSDPTRGARDWSR
jgi:serine/threonine-protein kinase